MGVRIDDLNYKPTEEDKLEQLLKALDEFKFSMACFVSAFQRYLK